MTKVQNEYWKLQEQKRSNAANENLKGKEIAETVLHNRNTEAETSLHNRNTERETNRNNLEKERQGREQLVINTSQANSAARQAQAALSNASSNRMKAEKEVWLNEKRGELLDQDIAQGKYDLGIRSGNYAMEELFSPIGTFTKSIGGRETTKTVGDLVTLAGMFF